MTLSSKGIKMAKDKSLTESIYASLEIEINNLKERVSGVETKVWVIMLTCFSTLIAILIRK